MHVLIVTQYFWPENFRINDVALGLKEKGHQVTVLTGQPNYPDGRFFPGYGFWSRAEEGYQGIRVFRVPLFPRGNGGKLRLLQNYLSFAFFASLLVAVPSRQEAMSIVVLEAGCAGKPVLITDQCGFGEVGHAGGGWVVPATVEGLRSGPVAILNDQNALAEHGRMLQRMVLERFQWTTVVKQYLSLYDQILHDHQSIGP